VKSRNDVRAGRKNIRNEAKENEEFLHGWRSSVTVLEFFDPVRNIGCEEVFYVGTVS